MKIRDFTRLGGSTVMDWLDNDGGYDAVRVPPGVILTRAQFRQWCRLRDSGDARAADLYAQNVSHDTTPAAQAA